MKRVIWYDPIDSDYPSVIVIDKIIRLSKTEDGEFTLIHLINGEVIKTSDSIRTIAAKLESDEE